MSGKKPLYPFQQRKSVRRDMANDHRTTHIDPVKALEQYRSGGSMSLYDRDLEELLFNQLQALEILVDRIGPTPLRHRLSEQVVQMRAEIWSFDQSKSEW